MNIKKLSLKQGLLTETNTNGDLIIPIIKKSLKHLNVGYRDDCCAETFCPVEPPCGGGGDLYLERTYAAATTDISNDELVPGALYKITDRNIFIEAISVNEFALDGVVQQYCPTQYTIGVDGNGNNWNGVYTRTLDGTDIPNGLWIWGGKVWDRTPSVTTVLADSDTNLAGPAISLLDPLTATNGEYILLTFGCEYDFVNDWIVRQWDNKGNIMGCSKTHWQDTLGLEFSNPCTITDWNSSITDNNCISIHNNTTTGIRNNYYEKMVISNNRAAAILQNTNKGSIISCGENCVIQGNENNGNIQTVPDDTNVKYCKYNGNVDGDLATIVGDINGREPKEISVSPYTAEPWDWNNVYRETGLGDTTITIPFDYPNSYNCTHVSMIGADLIFAAANAFIDIFNADGHTKSNGQYAPVVVYTASSSTGGFGNLFILGGNTKA